MKEPFFLWDLAITLGSERTTRVIDTTSTFLTLQHTHLDVRDQSLSFRLNPLISFLDFHQVFGWYIWFRESARICYTKRVSRTTGAVNYDWFVIAHQSITNRHYVVLLSLI